MAIAFNGPAKLITLSSGTTTLDVVDLYSEWKRWVALGNANFLPAFAPVGGDPIDATAGTSIPLYAFLVNGWRVRPQEADHVLSVSGGVLLVDGGGDPFVNTVGDYTVRVNYQQPVQAITVSTSGGGGAGLTTEQDTMLRELWTRMALNPAVPLTNTESAITAGSIEIAVVQTSTSSTFTRT